MNLIFEPGQSNIIGLISAESPAMYRTNFCVECGERLARGGWRAWIGARFCVECGRRLGRNGLAKPIAIIAIVGVLAFALGRSLRPTAPPLLIQRAANSPLSDLPVSLNDSLRTANRKDGNPKNSSQIVSSADDPVYICGARTKKGTPCHRRVHTAGERCFQHKGMSSLLPLSKLVVRP